MTKYRTPTIDEFVIGFKFESNYCYFSRDGEWKNAEITSDNIEDVITMYEEDAYPSEFRVKI